MADTKEADSKRKEPAKKGLHGWKAALAVFGCGTLAAFGTFGVVVGVLSLFIGTVSSGITTSETPINQPGAGIGAPRADLDVGEMDVCTDNLGKLSTITVDRQDSGDSHVDTTDSSQIDIDGVSRLVSDDCLWEFKPHGNSTPWDFEFSYEAIIDAEAGKDRDELAASRFDELRDDLPSTVENVASEKESPWGDSSYSVYGTDASGRSVYVALVQTRSAVYSIRFEDKAEQSVGQVAENTFLQEGRKVTNFLKQGFDYWIPE
ncbi:hypothetical protein [Nocardiopsis ganjiahuensis]|uniref:hypothetical protein n=1 Tax=Nocardiopsis ganjiahuensis TaxID=239984 RepID=UPI001267B04A|nr:hypothetical protein [Nocardiopsis ganjiahuensis]